MSKPKLPTPPKPSANPPPATQRAEVNKPLTPQDAAVQAQLQMPNERDESIDGAATITADVPDPIIKQAALDVARDLQDTSKGAELNRAYKKLK